MAKAGIVYAATDDGVVIFSDPASIGRWRRVGHALAGQAARAQVAHSALALHVAADAGVQRSDDGGQSWEVAGPGGALMLAAHPAAPAALWLVRGADAPGVVERSDDGGASWRPCPQGERPRAASAALLVDPHAALRLLLALKDGEVWASPDGGERWDALGAGLAAPLASLVVSPGRVNLLWAAAGGALFRAGESALWAQVAGQSGPALQLFDGPLAVLPGKSEVLLAAGAANGSYGLARSDDDGDHWQIAATDAPLAAPITALAAASYHIDTAWAGSADGNLLLSDDRGRSWRTIARGLAPVRALAAVRLA
jgi:photosystem II stability/assembly factor-like uncharacterized protein